MSEKNTKPSFNKTKAVLYTAGIVFATSFLSGCLAGKEVNILDNKAIKRIKNDLTKNNDDGIVGTLLTGATNLAVDYTARGINGAGREGQAILVKKTDSTSTLPQSGSNNATSRYASGGQSDYYGFGASYENEANRIWLEKQHRYNEAAKARNDRKGVNTEAYRITTGHLALDNIEDRRWLAKRANVVSMSDEQVRGFVEKNGIIVNTGNTNKYQAQLQYFYKMYPSSPEEAAPRGYTNMKTMNGWRPVPDHMVDRIDTARGLSSSNNTDNSMYNTHPEHAEQFAALDFEYFKALKEMPNYSNPALEAEEVIAKVMKQAASDDYKSGVENSVEALRAENDDQSDPSENENQYKGEGMIMVAAAQQSRVRGAA